MSWNDVEPIVRAAPKCQASVSLFSKIGARLTLSFSDSFWRELGEPKQANVSIGSGENEGMLRCSFVKSGKFEIVENAKGGGRLFIPAVGIADGEREGHPCEIVSSGKDVLVVKLPLAVWNEKERRAEASAAQFRNSDAGRAAAEQIARAAPREVAAAVDAVKYLTGKGHSVARRKDKTLAVDGAVLDAVGVVRLVNKHRADADLAPLTAAQVSL